MVRNTSRSDAFFKSDRLFIDLDTDCILMIGFYRNFEAQRSAKCGDQNLTLVTRKHLKFLKAILF